MCVQFMRIFWVIRRHHALHMEFSFTPQRHLLVDWRSQLCLACKKISNGNYSVLKDQVSLMSLESSSWRGSTPTTLLQHIRIYSHALYAYISFRMYLRRNYVDLLNIGRHTILAASKFSWESLTMHGPIWSRSTRAGSAEPEGEWRRKPERSRTEHQSQQGNDLPVLGPVYVGSMLARWRLRLQS